MKTHKNCLSVAILTSLTFSAPTHADSLADIFKDIGTYANVTGPGAYEAQGANVYIGGNLYARAPAKNFNPVQVALPSLRAGCGGIDLYMGSFSFVNKDQLVQMMKTIGAGAVSYAFKIALDAISPQINKTITELQQITQDLNAININSCEASEAIARGMTGDWQRTSQYFASVAGPLTGKYEDHSEARAATKGNETKTQDVNDAITDPKLKPQVDYGNVVWRALKNIPSINDTERELLMSLTGTYIKLDNNSDSLPTALPPKINTVVDFVRGSGLAGAGKIDIYRCADGTSADACRSLTDAAYADKPFAEQIQAKLKNIAAKFRTNATLSADEIEFIQATSIPIYKALAALTASSNAGIENSWIARHAELIGTEYAYVLILQLSAQIDIAIANTPFIANEVTKHLDAIKLRLDGLRRSAKQETEDAFKRVASIHQIAQEVLFYERQIHASLPKSIANNLRFADAVR